MQRTSLVVAVSLAAIAATASLQAQRPSSDVHASRLILRVSDLAASTAFYRDRVGLPLQSLNDEFATFESGGLLLMLEHLPKPPSGPSSGLAAFTEVVLESADVKGAYEAMHARGVTFRRDLRAVTSDDTRVMYAADFRDPDGHILSIAGWVTRTANN